MTGLKRYRRDPRMPERLGEPRLAPPHPDDVLAWVGERLLVPGAPAPRSATWEFARWKPGVSITCVYGVELEDGGVELVGLKRYRSDKARHLAERGPSAGAGAFGASSGGQRLRGRAFADEHTVLWTPAADRELPGLARLLDPRRPARWLEEAGVVPERSVRRRRTACALVRYKPERRAVALLDLSLRAGPEKRRTFAVRVLPPAEAERVVAARRALATADPAAPVVPLTLAQAGIGILVEEWLALTTFADDSFDHAEMAGRGLARLHGAPLAGLHRALARLDPAAAPDEDSGSAGGRALLARLGIDASAVPMPRDELRAWVHGDLHPDQVALEGSGAPLLLDLDQLGPGDPRRDLASWIADRLAADPAVDLETAAAPLLAGYRAERRARSEPPELAGFVADELVQRAAAALRRLEHDGMARARVLVELARDLASGKTATAGAGRQSHLEDALAALAAHCRDVRAPEHVYRADVSRDGELFLALGQAGGERWFRCAPGGIEELEPARDTALPLAARLVPGCAERVLSWRPGRRIVLRSPDKILKGHRPKHLHSAVRAHSLGASVNANDGFRVPALGAVLEEESALALELLVGEPPRVTARNTAVFRTAGARLRAMQQGSADELAAFGARDELGVLDRWRDRLASVAVALPDGWGDAAQVVARAGANLPGATPVPCHRDLHDGQLLATPQGVALLDFDLLCAADPALDAGNLLAHLRLRALQRLGSADEMGAVSCGAAFLEGLGRADEPGLGARLQFYEATSYLRLALVYSLRPRWRRLAPILTRLAERALAGAPHEVQP